MDSEEKQHKLIIQDFLKYLNARTNNFILKGGTALRLCYRLPRFSENIDLDAEKENILSYVQDYCKKRHFDVRIAKDMPTVKECMINYGNKNRPLKVEVSYRNRNIDKTNCIEINHINVYDVNRLAKMKAMAYSGRDKIRDMYDLSFICNNFWNDLSKETKENIRDALIYKGIEQFEYIVASQSDDKINEIELLLSFLQMCDNAGILSDDSKPFGKTGNERL